MNEIRKNNEKEITYIKAKFDMPKVYKTLYCFFIITFIIVAIWVFIIMFKSDLELYNSMKDYSSKDIGEIIFSSLLYSILPLAPALFIYLIFRKHKKIIKERECVITNKVVQGKIIYFFARKNYSYRLDEIDNVEVHRVLGVEGLLIHYSQGKNVQNININYGGAQQTIRNANELFIGYIANAEEMYKKLTDLIKEVKNQIDTEIDIEMKKIEAEEKKAEAFAKMASGMVGNSVKEENDYITQMERLFKLKEQGIITDEEFEEKKKQLL